MKRYAINDLRTWKKSRHRKPLLVQGARQVGKTWLLREFGRQEYANTAYVNLAENDEAAAAFEGTLRVDGLVRKLSAAAGEAIQAGETLIVLDEIQASERALNALKFFRENAPQYHVAAAGSLLGVALNHNHMSFPVGQVDFLDLHPLGFCEFLEALGEDALCGYLQHHDWELMETMRARYTELLRLYLCIGGMPEAVAAFAEVPDFAAVGRIHRAILQSYENDFGKYISRKDFANIRAVWGAVPRMLAHERKFSYSKVKPGGRGRDFEGSIEWLCRSGLLHRVSREENVMITPINNGRADYRMQDIFGMFVKTLPIVTTVNPKTPDTKQTVVDAVRQMQEQFFDAQERDFYPFTRMVERHGVEALICYAYQAGLFEGGKTSLGESFDLHLDTVKFPIDLNINDGSDGEYEIAIDYDDTKYSHEDIVLLEDDEVDLGDLARTAFILDMDTKFLCAPDCKGLCPGCGVNLNFESCRCKKEVDPRLAKLAQLLENK